MNPEPAHTILKAIFDQIVGEAEKNPAFATRLLSALPKGAIAEIRKVTRPNGTKKLDAATVNPVKILRETGDVSLRNILGTLTKAELSQVVVRNQFTLPEDARGKKATKDAIVKGIVSAAEFRLRERAA